MTEKFVVINEKGSQCDNFAKALGGYQGGFDGYSYVLTHSYGHVLGLPVPEQAATSEARDLVGKFSNTKNIPWKYQWFDFSKRVTTSPHTSQVVQDVKDYLNQGYIPVIASDIDDSGEGDLLVWEIINYCNYAGPVYREYHVDESSKAIQKAMKRSNLKPVTHDDSAYRIAVARTNMDYMTQELTRLATKRLTSEGYRMPTHKVKVNGKNKEVPQVVPMGRLKGVMMRIIGDQEIAIKNYKPHSEFESRYKLGDLVLSRNDMPRFQNKNDWKHDDLPDESSVKEVKQIPGVTKPPKAFTLSEVAGQMAKFGMKSKKTMDLYQQMYEASYLSYPRTEDNFISPEQFNDATAQLDQVLYLLDLPNENFTHRQPRPGYVKTGSSHGALRYGAKLPESLSVLVAKFGKGADTLWKLVSTRFVQMYLEDTEWVRHDYETIDTPVPFTGSVRVITKPGVIDPDKPIKAAKLPDLRDKAQLYLHELKSTRPHKITSSWFFDQLKKCNVGTGATRLSTLAAISSSDGNSPIKESKELSLTTLGWIGYEFAKQTKIGSVDGTVYIQDLLKDVRKGGSFEEAYQKFEDVLANDAQAIRQMELEFKNIDLPKREFASGVWNGENVKFNRVLGGYRFSDSEVADLLAGKTIRFTVKNNPVVGKLAHLEYKGVRYVGVEAKREKANGTWHGQEIAINKTYMDHTFSDDELAKLFAGQEIEIETHKGDKTYHLVGKLEKQVMKTDKGKIEFIGFKGRFPLKPGHVRITWKGKECVIKDSYMDHKFTDGEITALASGETIKIETHKDGKTYNLEGKLQNLEFTKDGKTYKYVGFKGEFPLKPGYKRGTWHGKTVTFKGSFMKHDFTDSEVTKLLAGEVITFTGTSSKGKEMKVSGKLANQEYKGHPFVGFEADWK